ncbi:hypothetical protein [Gordonia sp. NB41Y]|uniref:phage tail tube protein n=1 Tax=Gordonia sp. NB41Y TaxID=875808 RepID=UPI0002BF6B4A|nr:hypothetical protein [Gordonia sp. NB41Y]WLP90257.1 hypothetical protein Q9K23_22530 [Gordonia sp. NB41Y]
MTAPLQATSTADLSVATSGLYRVEIDLAPGKDTDPSAAPASGGWTEILGIQKWAPKFEQVTEDDTDLSSGGWKSEYPVGNGFTVDIEGLTKGEEDPSFVADPGVQALLDASENFGRAGIVHMRYWRTDALPEAKAFYASCKVSRNGEKPPALDKWSGTLTGKGAPTAITKPTGSITKVFTLGSGVTAFTATVDSQTTASITTLTAAGLKSALEALSNVGAGNVTVTGSSGGPFTAVFTVPVTVVSANGTGGTVTVA